MSSKKDKKYLRNLSVKRSIFYWNDCQSNVVKKRSNEQLSAEEKALRRFFMAFFSE